MIEWNSFNEKNIIPLQVWSGYKISKQDAELLQISTLFLLQHLMCP